MLRATNVPLRLRLALVDDDQEDSLIFELAAPAPGPPSPQTAPAPPKRPTPWLQSARRSLESPFGGLYGAPGGQARVRRGSLDSGASRGGLAAAGGMGDAADVAVRQLAVHNTLLQSAVRRWSRQGRGGCALACMAYQLVAWGMPLRLCMPSTAALCRQDSSSDFYDEHQVL